MHVSAGKFACVVFTDIHRSSHLWEFFPREYAAALERHKQTVEAAILASGGEIIKGLGDGYLLMFSSAEASLAVASQIMEAAGAEPGFPDGTPFKLKIACHAGHVSQLFEGNDFFGPVLNAAARLCQICNAGQLLASADILRLCPTHQLKRADLGVHYFRDVAEPLTLFQVWAHGEQPKFADLATLEHKPTNLRAAIDSFVGRETELAQLCTLLKAPDYRLVTIVAPGGYGKTRLADHACHDLLSEFDHGVYEIRLADLSLATAVGDALAEALGVLAGGNADPIQQVGNFLRRRNILLYFDNFEHVLGAAPVLTRLLEEAPGLKCLITSREPLRLKGERIFHLQPLALETPDQSLSPAALLFMQRALLDPEAQDLQIVEELCQHLAGIPLALELAAAWTDVYEPSELLASFHSSLEITGRARDLHLRHSSVRDCLNWSFKLLDEHSQAAILKLGVFRNGFTSRMASEVLGDIADPLLAVLIDKCWLAREKGTQRFGPRDVPTQEYVSEALAKSDLFEPSSRAHLEVFAKLLAEFSPLLGTDQEPAALATLRPEAENVTAALTFAARFGSPATAELLRSWSKTLIATGQIRQLAGLLDSIAAGLTSQAELFQHHLARGVCAIQLQEFRRAETELSAALDLAHEMNDGAALAMTLSHLGHCRYWQLDYDSAETLLSESLRIYSGLGLRSEAAAPQHNLAITHFVQGRVDEAERLLHNCLQVPHQSKSWTAIHLQALRYCATARRDYTTAGEYGRRSLDLYRELGNVPAEAREILSLAELECYAGQAAQMRDYAQQAQSLAAGLGDPTLGVHCLLALAQAELLAGQTDAADATLNRAISQLETQVAREQRFGVYSLKQVTDLAHALEYFRHALDEVAAGLRDEYALQALIMLSVALCLTQQTELGGALLGYCKGQSAELDYTLEASHLEGRLVSQAEDMLGQIQQTSSIDAPLRKVCQSLVALNETSRTCTLANLLLELATS